MKGKISWFILAFVAILFVFTGSSFYCNLENQSIQKIPQKVVGAYKNKPNVRRVNVKFSPGTPQKVKEKFFKKMGLVLIEYDVFGYDIAEARHPQKATSDINIPKEFEKMALTLPDKDISYAYIESYEKEGLKKTKAYPGRRRPRRKELIVPWYDQRNKYSIQLNDAHNFIKEKRIPLSPNGVVVVDSGPEFMHDDIRPVLRYKLREPYFWVSNRNRMKYYMGDHGTHVSCLAAGHRDMQGVEGVAAPNSYILPLIVNYNDFGFYFASDIARGLKHYRKLERRGEITFHAVNMSFMMFFESKVVLSAIKRMKRKVFVVAAGNEKMDMDTKPKMYPAGWRLPNIISVAAYAESGKLAHFSNYGRENVDIAAPGVNVPSCVIGNKYESWAGTSMASPLVAGTVSLLFSIDPDASVRRIKNVLFFSAISSRHLEGKVKNARQLNINAAVRHLWFLLNWE
ncbi:S8 family serine peptidase [Candidatus Parcubacteria bacterium]|nr:S8 family serine peptidase [Patescibacteria group bacterium]MCG2693830.1 S8 family serine peptidase [Candidatus Parcubacteria bacterium]